MNLSSVLFLLWTFFGSLNGGANPWLACNQDNNLDMKIRGCTLIVEGEGWGAKDAALALTYRGLAHAYNGDDGRATADFNRAIAALDSMIQRNSLDSTAFWIRGIAYRASKNYTQAFADYDEAIRLDPHNFDAFNSRCWARALLGTELQEARRDCDTAIRLSNGATYFLDSRGMVALKEGKFADAWADYDAALRAEPSYASALYGRGIAALRLGRREEGNADLREALKFNPNIAKMFTAFGMTP